MKLIVILLCLGLERYLKVGNLLKRSTLTQQYVELMAGLLNRFKLPSVWLELAAYILPLWFVLLFVLMMFGSSMAGLLAIIIHVGVLILCLGPDDLHHQVAEYFSAVEKNDSQKADEQLAMIVGEKSLPDSASGKARALTNALLLKANSRFFAILFWYVMPFGLFFAVLYRVLKSLACSAAELSLSDPLRSANILVLNILNWVPARLSAIFYGLVGNFGQMFNRWLSGLKLELGLEDALLEECGGLALGLASSDTDADVNENRAAFEMIDRVLVLVMILIGISTIVSWVS